MKKLRKLISLGLIAITVCVYALPSVTVHADEDANEPLTGPPGTDIVEPASEVPPETNAIVSEATPETISNTTSEMTLGTISEPTSETTPGTIPEPTSETTPDTIPEAKEYTITFTDLKDETITTVSVPYDELLPENMLPKLEAYKDNGTFIGWYDLDTAKKINDAIQVRSKEIKEAEADYTKKVDAFEALKDNEKQAIDTANYLPKIPDPLKKEDTDKIGKCFDFASPINEDKTLKGIWIPKEELFEKKPLSVSDINEMDKEKEDNTPTNTNINEKANTNDNVNTNANTDINTKVNTNTNINTDTNHSITYKKAAFNESKATADNDMQLAVFQIIDLNFNIVDERTVEGKSGEPIIFDMDAALKTYKDEGYGFVNTNYQKDIFNFDNDTSMNQDFEITLVKERAILTFKSDKISTEFSDYKSSVAINNPLKEIPGKETIKAKPGYDLSKITWILDKNVILKDGTTINRGTPLTTEELVNAPISEDMKITASLPLVTFHITSKIEGVQGGTLSIEKSNVNAGTESTITINVAQGYHLSSVTVNGIDVSPIVEATNKYTYKLTNIQQDTEVIATFGKDAVVRTDVPTNRTIWLIIAGFLLLCPVIIVVIKRLAYKKHI